MTLTVLIDGPSGSGKTTLAGGVAATLGARVVHLDDFYPGWSGLKSAAHMVATTVLRLNEPGYRRWDWEKNRPGEWVEIDPDQDLIVEGVGAITAASVAAARRRGALVTVVVDAPAALRKRRALIRDQGQNYESFWDMWAAQEREHFLSWVENGLVPDFIIPSRAVELHPRVE